MSLVYDELLLVLIWYLKFVNLSGNASNETNEVLNKYSKDICSGTLADSLETKEVSGMQDIELNSEVVKLKVEKV